MMFSNEDTKCSSSNGQKDEMKVTSVPQVPIRQGYVSLM
jgi:hypothetical protein